MYKKEANVMISKCKLTDYNELSVDHNIEVLSKYFIKSARDAEKVVSKQIKPNIFGKATSSFDREIQLYIKNLTN